MSFLDYTGEVNKINNIFYFQIKKRNIPLRSSCATEILNPVLYSTFKFIFSQNKEITKNFLNSLIFNEEKQIKELEYVRSKLPMIKEDKYGKNIKRTNVV